MVSIDRLTARRPDLRRLLLFLLLLSVVASFRSAAGVSAQPATQAPVPALSGDELLACRTAVEQVYWAAREWPAGNPGPKPPLSAVLSPEQIAAEMADVARQSNALDLYWQSPITGAMLQAEMERQAAHTRAPDTLRALYAALDDDPLLVAECLARPALAERLLVNRQSQDARFSERPFDDWWATARDSIPAELTPPSFAYALPEIAAPRTPGGIAGADDVWEETAAIPLQTRGVSVWTGAEFIFLGNSSSQGFRYRPATDTWATMTTQNGPVGVFDFTAVWSGSEMITFGGCTGGSEFCTTNQTARYNPVTDTWSESGASGAPTPRRRHGAVWSGSEMIIWGGCRENATGNQNCNILLDSGGRYNPATDSWQAISQSNAPAARNFPNLVWADSLMILWSGAAAGDPGRRYDPVTNSWSNISTVNAPPGLGAAPVWTGSELIAWGGCTGSPFCDTAHNEGGRYDPAGDSWTPMSTTNAPVGRWAHNAVWSGSEYIVWGGTNDTIDFMNTGGRYDPTTDSWSATNSAGTPNPRHSHQAHWIGGEMLVWGGVASGGGRNGSRFSPTTDSWTPISAEDPNSIRYLFTAVWTGAEMIAWGGLGDGQAATGLNTGRRYDPALDHWSSTSTTNAPSARDDHSAVWTGSEMIIWGGPVISSSTPGTGGRYNPASDSWTPTSTSGAPVGRANHSAVWTGSEMIVWGGSVWDFPWDNRGGRYDPATDSWTPMNLVGAPQGRYLHSAVWTGNLMLIWGGTGSAGPMGNGARYDPGSDSWSPITGANAPTERAVHVTVWTGSEMIVWGGTSDYNPWTNLNSGGRYNPAGDVWTPTTLTDAPSPRSQLVGVWTGAEMVVWSGCTGSSCLLGDASGGRYDPAADAWTPTTTVGAPEARVQAAAVWAGDHMIVWGGITDHNGITNTGGRYYVDAPPNSPPTAVNDAYQGPQDTPLQVAAPGVLGNDSDPDGNPLTALLESGPTHGNLTLNPNGSFSYVPEAGFVGDDSFSYRAWDGAAQSNPATVSLEITAVNQGPTAADDGYALLEDTPLNVAAPGVLGNDSDPDGDPLTALLESGPAHGDLTLNPDGSFSYVPDAGFVGDDSFTYRADDGDLSSEPATASLEVKEVNEAPAAADDAYDLDEDDALHVAAPGVLGNDGDPDGDPLTALLESGPAHGDLTLNADGSFTYEPEANFHGEDSFSYRATDGIAESAPVTVTLTVAEVNDAPTATADSYETPAGEALMVAAPGLLANDDDLDGDPLTAHLESGPAHGSLMLNEDGSFTYVPEAGFSGTDTFTYRAEDGRGGSAEAVVAITVAEGEEEEMWLMYVPVVVSRP